MPIVCWGNLAKSADSTERIEQSIQAYIEGHDENPNAHMGEDYALGAHRLQIEIDHLPLSARNSLMYPTARTYKAIVDSAGYGDYLTLQAALVYVNSIGGGSIYLKSGHYYIDDDIQLSSNTNIVGEDAEMTIIDFDGAEKRIIAQGSSGTHLRNIEFHNVQIKGMSSSDDWGMWFIYCDDIKFQDCKFLDFADPYAENTGLIAFDHCKRVTVNNCYFKNCEGGMYMSECDQLNFEFNYYESIASWVLYVSVSTNVVFRHNRTYLCGSENADSMIYFTDGCNDLIFDSNIFDSCRTVPIWSENGSRIAVTNNTIGKTGTVNHAISISGCDRSIICNNRITTFTTDGIYIYGDDDYCVINSNAVTNCGGYGIKIDGATNDKNVVVGNCLVSNSSGAVSDSGTGTVVANNAS